jgi:hypothetical protein
MANAEAQRVGELMNSERNYLFAVVTAFIVCGVVAYFALEHALVHAVIYW